MTNEIKSNLHRNQKLMNNLMTQTVYTKTQCLKKQANFYNKLSRYNQAGRSHESDQYEPEITVTVNP